MSDAEALGRPSDTDLVAYLDGELSPNRRDWVAAHLAADDGLRACLARLANGARPFQEAFEPLLAQAPMARLATMLDGLPTYRPTGAERRPSAPRWPRLGLVAACAAGLFIGAGADRLLVAMRATVTEQAEEQPDEWRRAVAGYVTLYTPETLAAIPDDSAARQRELAGLSAKLDVPLSAYDTALPGLALKWTQLLQYDGKPLGEMVYADPQSGPVTLCVFADGEADAAPRQERRNGLNIVYWSAKGRAFMLVGRMAEADLRPLADGIYRRLTL
jgi:anti-sigma factor RsiW